MLSFIKDVDNSKNRNGKQKSIEDKTHKGKEKKKTTDTSLDFKVLMITF